MDFWKLCICTAAGLAVVGLDGAARAQAYLTDDFCQRIEAQLTPIIEDFGVQSLAEMSDPDLAARLATFYTGGAFEEEFGFKMHDIPEGERSDWDSSIVQCGHSEAHRRTPYKQFFFQVGIMMRFTLREARNYAYQAYLDSVAAHERLDTFRSGGLSNGANDLESYQSLLALEQSFDEEMSILRPSLVQGLPEQIEERRRAVLDGFVASETERLSTLEPSPRSVESVVSSMRDLAQLENVPNDEIAALNQVWNTYFDTLDSIATRLRESQSPQDFIASSARMLEHIPPSLSRPYALILEYRHSALENLLSGLKTELSTTDTTDGIADIVNRYQQVATLRTDRTLPAAQSFETAAQSRRAELAKREYDAGCDAYLTGLEIPEETGRTAMIGSQGTVPFREFVCAVRDQGGVVSSFSGPGFFSSILTLELTSKDGDYFSVDLKKTTVGSGEDVFVGDTFTDAVESQDFTLESWKNFVNRSAGL